MSATTMTATSKYIPVVPAGKSRGATTVGFAYDDANRRTSLTRPNGVVTEYGYDAATRLTSLVYRSGGVAIGDLTYVYNAAGRPPSRPDSSRRRRGVGYSYSHHMGNVKDIPGPSNLAREIDNFYGGSADARGREGGALL
jgi:YD repeat-containing protein